MMGYYSAMKNEPWIQATTWMKLENIILNREAGHERLHVVSCPSYFYEKPTIGSSVETENRK